MQDPRAPGRVLALSAPVRPRAGGQGAGCPVLQPRHRARAAARPGAGAAAQPLGRGVVAAAPGNQRLDLPLEAVLAQTGRALVQVHADLAAVVVGYLTVEVEVNLLDHLSTVGLVWTTAAHAAPPSARTAEAAGRLGSRAAETLAPPASASVAAGINPRSTA